MTATPSTAPASLFHTSRSYAERGKTKKMLESDELSPIAIANIQVHPAMLMKTKEGEKEEVSGVRCQVSGARPWTCAHPATRLPEAGRLAQGAALRFEI